MEEHTSAKEAANAAADQAFAAAISVNLGAGAKAAAHLAKPLRVILSDTLSQIYADSDAEIDALLKQRASILLAAFDQTAKR